MNSIGFCSEGILAESINISIFKFSYNYDPNGVLALFNGNIFYSSKNCVKKLLALRYLMYVYGNIVIRGG